MKTEKFEWQLLEDVPGQEQEFPATQSNNAPADTLVRQAHRGEFMVALLIVCLILALAFLYQTNLRIAALETQFLQLQEQPKSNVQPESQLATESAAIYTSESAQNSLEVLPQWLAIADVHSIYHTIAELHGREWHWQEPYIGQRHAAQSLPLYLTLVTNQRTSITQPYGTEGWSSHIQYELANPLIEFILTQYGDEIIPTLLDAFTQHDNWDTLAPAVFNMTATEFEAEWHAYLEETYPQNDNGFGESPD